MPSRPSRSKAYAYGGLLVAAAAALFMIFGPQRRTEPDFGVKGVDTGTGAKVACQVEPRTTAGVLKPTSDGLGYEAPAGSAVQLAARCASPVYIHVRALDAAGMLIGDHRDFRLAGSGKELIGDGSGQPLSLAQPAGGATISLVVTATAKPTAGPDIPQDQILWSDEMRLVFK
jgi:hypothetical protein